MTLTTDAYWDVDGEPINNHAFNIRELNGLVGAPGKKGSDLQVPYRDGELWRPKSFAAATRTMLMWISYKDEDGNIPATRALRWGQYQANQDFLFGLLLANTQSQRLVTKRVFNPDGSLSTRSFLGEVINTVDPLMPENDHWPSSEMAVEWKCADPFYYGAEQSFDVEIGAGAHDMPGNVQVSKLVLRLVGPLTNPRLTNSTFAPDIWVQYTGVIGMGEFVDLDTEFMTAVDDASANVINSMSKSGSRQWMNLTPGSNVFDLTADAGSGKATITYQPPYLS